MNDLRIPIMSGTIIKVNGNKGKTETKIKIGEYIGAGSTCLAYTGEICAENVLPKGTRVIVKEFYPKHMDEIFRDEKTCKLTLGELGEVGKGEYENRKKQFETGYRVQQLLANSDAMEVMIKPYVYGTWGESTYLVSGIHKSFQTVEKTSFTTVQERLECALLVVEMMGILHESGYIMMDFKPENILWIGKPKGVKLIDVDSVFGYGNLKEPIDAIYQNDRYAPPETKIFKEVSRDKNGWIQLHERERKLYLQPKLNVYSLGKFLFELMFDRLPMEKDLQWNRKVLQTELLDKYDGIKDKSLCENLLEIMEKAMSKIQHRFQDGNAMLEELIPCVEKITLQKYAGKKVIRKANGMYLTYNMLEKHPLYRYIQPDGNGKKIDVAIVGEHSLRKDMLKGIFSCGQMEGIALHIRLFAKDVEKFWDSLCEENPELQKTVCCQKDDVQIIEAADIEKAGITKEPLAYIHLYESHADIHEVLHKNKSNYVIYLKEEQEENIKDAEKFIEEKKETAFVGYLSETQREAIQNTGVVDVFCVDRKRISEKYNENLFKSHVYEMGLAVHAYYTQKSITKEEMRKSYEKNVYNMESSINCALHTHYKMIAVGLNPDLPEVAHQFYETVLQKETPTANKLFERLVALEHKRWNAYMVMSGARAINSMDEFRTYAFVGANDWKDQQDTKHTKHPCLISSGYEKRIRREDFEKTQEELQREGFDPLDCRSVAIYQETRSIVMKRKVEIEGKLNRIKDFLPEVNGEEGARIYKNLMVGVKCCFDNDKRGKKLWAEAIAQWKGLCEEKEQPQNLTEVMDGLVYLMKPVLWSMECNDFKKSDEAMLYAIPKILHQNMDGKLQIVKPITPYVWKNIHSTLALCPKRLILVVDDLKEKETIQKQYEEIIQRYQLHTTVIVCTQNQVVRYKGDLYLDETGSEMQILWDEKKRFSMENGEAVLQNGEKWLSSLQEYLYLSVKDLQYICGCTINIEEKKIGKWNWNTCQKAWHIWKEVEKTQLEEFFAKQIGRGKKIKSVSLSTKKDTQQYHSDYLEGNEIYRSQMVEILKELAKKQYICNLSFPVEQEDGQVHYETMYEPLAKAINQMLKESASSSKYVYKMDFVDKKILFTKDTLYEKVILENDSTEAEKWIAVMQKYPSVFQNLEISSGKKITCNLRYASWAMKELLEDPKTLQKLYQYHKTQEEMQFDDLQVDVEVEMDRGETCVIPMVGTKNGMAYFFCSPEEKEYVEEWYQMLGLDGKIKCE